MRQSKPFKVRPIWILTLLLAMVTHSLCEQLPVRTYTTADGLARDRVYKIVTDPRGFLWFCTYDGLSRFDGYEFVNYGIAKGLPHRIVYDLLITRQGDYWVATAGGIARFNAFANAGYLKFKAYVPSRPGSELISVLREGSDGRIWAGTGNGLHELREVNGNWELEYVSLGERVEDRLEVTSIVEDSPGVLWFGTFTGLFHRHRDGNLERFTTQNGLPHDHIRDILKDRDGNVWVATGLGLCRLESEIHTGRPVVSRLYTKKDGIVSENINAIFKTSSGWLWIGTSSGLSEFSSTPLANGGHFFNYSREHGLNDAGIRCIAEDQDGNLWLGSESGGAMKVTRRGFTSYSEADGLESGRITAIEEDRNGELYVITGSLKVPSFHIHQFDGRRFENTRVNLPPSVLPAWGWDQLFVQDRLQQWWVPTANGLFRFPAMRSLREFAKVTPLNVYDSRSGLTGDEPFRLFEDSRGDVWISIITRLGKSLLNRWERVTEKFYHYDSPQLDPRAHSAATAFREDRARNVWIGFYEGGLARYHDGKFDFFTTTDGLPRGMIRALHLDAKGRLWVASTEGGLARIDDPTLDHPSFVHYTVKEGLSSDQISCITEDQWGRIYIGTGLGVDRLDPTTGRVKRYTIADGLPNGFVNVAFRGRNGVLWFGTLQGLSKLVPTIDGPSQPPSILIQAIRVAGNDVPISELGVTQTNNLEFEASKNQLEIKFLSLGFGPGDSRRYQFMLEGADGDWGAPVTQRTVNYANLKPGSYRFRVRAINADGLASSEPAVVAFTIVPPVWQRFWFLALIGLLVVVTTHLVYRYHTRRLIELERVRTRIATDLHDDIGASLSKIAILSDVACQELPLAVQSPVGGSLAEIADTSRDCVDSMSDIVWAVNPQRDHLSDLTQRMRRFAEDLLDAKDINFSIRSAVDEKDVLLGADLRREAYLIFKECVNNLAKHSQCSNARITFSITGAWLVISVVDDGRGFAFEESSHGPVGMGGHGLMSMRRRAEALGGTLIISSNLGKGTNVTLKVPLNSRRRWRWWPIPTQKGGDA